MKADEFDFSLLAGRLPPNTIRLLTQMNKVHLRLGDSLTPWHLIPFWFGNAPAPKGFARIKAPDVSPDRLRRILALDAFAKAGDENANRVASVYANALLWASLLPNETARFAVDAVFDFDPDDVESWVKSNKAVSSEPFAISHSIHVLDPVRIAYNQL